MSLVSPSPDSSPIVDPSPVGDSPPAADPPSSSENPKDTPPSPPPPPDSSASPPQSSPTGTAPPPPSDSESTPPTTSTKPPPSPPSPSPPTPPPPSPPSPPAPPPPSPSDAPPPAGNAPPPPSAVPPPASPESSPPPPDPVAPPPSPPAVSPSPPPPPPPSDTSPPLPHAKPPKHSPPPPALPPPPATLPASPPSEVTAPNTTTGPPPSIPPSSLPPSLSPPAPQTNTSLPANPPLKPVPTEKPTARSTTPSPNITTATATSNAGGVNSGAAIAIGLIGFLALSLVVFAVWFVQKRKKKRSAFKLGYMKPSPFTSSQNSDSSFLRAPRSALSSANHSPYHSAQLSGSASTNSFMYSGDPGGIGSSRSWFTFQELAEATDSFSANNLLGEGGFGCVFKGVLTDGREVAVKQLKSGGGQGEREFRAEVEIISRIHHRHLVSLVGYCISDIQRLLVYDYVPNDTLQYHLHGEGKPAMTWATRYKVAAGAARGIAYLHEDCNPRIIHRDIKSANILLDNNFEAKVADFGLAKLAQELEAHTHVSTRVMGTFGYMAPEYATTGKLTEKSDVFSFGVVLLELITGLKPVDASRSLGDESLVEWARPLLAQALEDENFEDLVDPRLEKNYGKNEMLRMIEAAAACVRHLGSKRPRMSQVARALDSADEHSDLTNGMKPGESQIFDSRQHSEQMRMFQKMAFGSQEYSSDFFNNSQSTRRSGL